MLAGSDASPALCLIRRAERVGDPWSGHIALPGGRVTLGAESDRDAAERETSEEVGVVLEPTMFLGAMSELAVRIGGRDIGMTLAPFVYYVGPSPVELMPNHEVAQAFWTPLVDLWRLDAHATLRVARDGLTTTYPSIRIGPHQLWGLTYRVLAEFARIVGVPIPGPGP